VPAEIRRRSATGLSKGDLREARLIAVARGLVGDGKFEQASVLDLASAAEISRSSFYFYFASKQELLRRLVESALSDIAQGLAQELDQEPERPIPGLRNAISRGVDAWWENRAIMAIAFELAATDPRVYASMVATVEPVNALCVDLLVHHGKVPEAQSLKTAADLVFALALMNERVLAHALRTARNRNDLRRTETLLLTIWTRAMGLS
jgi:TetR/AcrR family transcriptional regulator, ethionamide resistance regulator